MWLYNIRKYKPVTYQLLMENQIKYYLHIQQVKKLYNEIEILKKHKRECKMQNLIDHMQRGILNREDLIFEILRLYGLMEYYSYESNIEKLKNIIKNKKQ